LLRKFHRSLLGPAKSRAAKPWLKLDGPEIDDLIGGACVGSSEAIKRFDTTRETRLWTYAQHYIWKEIDWETDLYWRKGVTGETRADRYAIDHPYDRPEELAAGLNKSDFKCASTDDKKWTPEAAEELLQTISARRNFGTYLTTAEGGISEDGHGAKDGVPIERKTPRWATPSSMASRHFDCFSPYQLSPHVKHQDETSLRLFGCSSRYVVDLWTGNCGRGAFFVAGARRGPRMAKGPDRPRAKAAPRRKPAPCISIEITDELRTKYNFRVENERCVGGITDGRVAKPRKTLRRCRNLKRKNAKQDVSPAPGAEVTSIAAIAA
jgi:hypothetical protein